MRIGQKDKTEMFQFTIVITQHLLTSEVLQLTLLNL